MASFVQSTVGIGLILGSLAFLILTIILSSSAFYSYGWRIPYLLAFIVLIIGVFIGLKIPEIPIFEAIEKENKIQKYPKFGFFLNIIKQNFYFQPLLWLHQGLFTI